MAKTDYEFSQNRYFTGVEQYNIYTFLKDKFFKNIVKTGYPFPITSQGTMAAVLGYEEYEFISGDAGNFSRCIRGDVAFRSRGREKLYRTQKELAVKGQGWLGAITADIPDGKLTDIKSLIAELYDFFLHIYEKRKEIQSQKTMCAGFDPQVLENLLNTLHSCADSVEGMPFPLRKRMYVSCLVAGVTYFFSNGSSYADFTQPEVSAAAAAVCAACAAEIPAADFVTDAKLMASLNCRGKNYTSLEELTEAMPFQSISVVADGGWGKTTAMRNAAIKLNSRGIPTLYIACNRADNLVPGSFAQKNFVADSIGRFFSGYRTGIDENNMSAARLLKKAVENELGYSRMVIFMDGLNETAAGAEIARQIKEITDITTNLQFVISSRFPSYQLKNLCAQSKLLPLDPQKIMTAGQYDVYKKLDKKTQNLLTGPMFLQLFINSGRDSNVNGASLLMYDLERNIAKINSPAVLNVFFPEFTLDYYLGTGKLILTADDLSDACRKYGFGDSAGVTETLKMSGYLVTDDDYTFVYRHEHMRDFFAALAILKKIKSATASGQLYTIITDVFSAEKNYSIYIRRFFAELAGRNTVIKMLESMRVDNMPDEVWRSSRTATATAAVTELLKVLTDNQPDTDFYGLNLTKTALNGCRITDSYFARSLVSDFTFSPKGHDSAVFAMCSDERGCIYALDKNTLIRYSHTLEQLDALNYSNGYPLHSHALSGSLMGAVNAKGRGYIFSLKGGLAVAAQLENAVSVEKATGGLLFGFADGCIRFYDYNGSVQWEVKVDSEPVMPVKNRISSEILYATSHQLKLWNRRTGTRTLWHTPDDMKIISCGYNSSCGSAVLVSNRFGETLVSEYSADRGTVETVWEIAQSEELADYLIKQSIGIDPVKCTAIAFDGNHMLNVYNNGSIILFEHTGSSWVYTDSIDVTNLKTDNPGFGIESACFVPGGIACGLTDRTVKIISCDFDSSANNGLEKHSVHGHNSGLRRICCGGDSLYLTMYDRGFVQMSRKSAGDKFTFKEKIMLNDDWCWDAVSIDENTTAFAAGDSVFVYDGNIKLCHHFAGKVEKLFYSGGILYIAESSKVYAMDTHNGFAVKAVDSDYLSRRRVISFARDPVSGNMYVGCSSDVGAGTGCIAGVIENSQLKYIDNSVWRYPDGWYRSMCFSDDGQYILCAGLKSEDSDGSVKNSAVIFDRRFNILAILTGHTKSVMNARFISSDNGRITVATCSYDGYVNIYTVPQQQLGHSLCLQPVKSCCVTGDRLMDMVSDGEDILVCCLNGSLYRLSFRPDEDMVTVEYENVCGLWTSYCDLSRTDSRSTLSEGMRSHLVTLNNTVRGSEH